MPVIVYSVLRLGLFALALLGLWAAGMGGWLLVVVGAVAAGALSYVLLGSQRTAAAIWIAERRAATRPRFSPGWRPTPRPRTPRYSGNRVTRVRARARGRAARRRRAPARPCRPAPGPAGCPARRPAPCRPAPRPGPGAAAPGATPVPRWRTPRRRGSPG